MNGTEATPSAFEMMLELIVCPPAPTPVATSSSPADSPFNEVSPLYGLPTKVVAAAELPESPTTPTLNKKLPLSNPVMLPPAEAKLDPLPPVPASRLTAKPPSAIHPEAVTLDANDLTSSGWIASLYGLPTKVVAAAELPEAPTRPTLNEKRPLSNPVLLPPAEAKLDPLPPVPASGLTAKPPSAIHPEAVTLDANDLRSSGWIASLCGLPTKVVAAAELPEAPATPTLNEKLPLSNPVLLPPAEAKLDPLPPVPASGLTAKSPSAIHPEAVTPDANELTTPVPTSSVSGCTNNETSQAERIQGEQSTTRSSTTDPVIERPPESIAQAAVEIGDATTANTSPATAAMSDSKSADLLATISGGLLAVNDAQAATSGVEDESTVEREHPIPSQARPAAAPTLARVDFEGYRNFITSTSSSGSGTNEFSPDEFGRGSTPLHPMGGNVSGSTSTAADLKGSDLEKFDRPFNDNTERVRSHEHRMQEETSSRVTAHLPHGHPQKVIEASAGAVSDQLVAAIVGQLEAAHDSTHTTFRLRLNPRELGTVDVHLSMVHDVVSIRFVAQDEAARQAIEQQLDDLRQSLTNSGVSLSQCHVGCHSGDRHPPHQHEAASPPFTRPTAAHPRWPRHRDHELPTTLPQGRLNFVA